MSRIEKRTYSTKRTKTEVGWYMERISDIRKDMRIRSQGNLKQPHKEYLDMYLRKLKDYNPIRIK